MFDPKAPLTDALVERVQAAWDLQYGADDPESRTLLAGETRAALRRISLSTALYHDIEHTAMVTLAGQHILAGRRAAGKTVTPSEWLHFVLSLLYHDVGLVGDLCPGDGNGVRATGIGDATVTPPRGATDAFLGPYHVDRAKAYVRERFAGHAIVDSEVLATNIERTRFPVPDEPERRQTTDFPGLVRAADLVGQLADPGHLRKLNALYYEFEEAGLNAKMGFANPDDLRDDYPNFFRLQVRPYVRDALAYLMATAEGREWVDALWSHLPAADRDA